VKRSLLKSLLTALTFAVVLGVGFQVRELPVRAQTAEVASAPEAQAPEKKEEKDPEDEYSKSPSVVWLGSKLGLNPDQSSLAFKLTNFLLLVIGVGWAAVKLLPKVLRSRDATIQKQLVDARTATEEARERLSGVEDRLAKLDGEIAAMRDHAEQDSVTEEQRIKATVEEEKKKILASAEQEIAAATMHAQKQLQQHAAELAIEQAARKLVVSAETDRLLVQGFAQRLTGDESKKGQN
jgi:F-type H+-transporting ATPase subunit b